MFEHKYLTKQENIHFYIFLSKEIVVLILFLTQQKISLYN